MTHPIENEPHDLRRPTRQELTHGAVEFVKMIIWFLVLFGILRIFVIEGYEVQGDSMDPTLNDRERILVFKLPHNLSKVGLLRGINAIQEGDVVVFDSLTESDKRYIKRVVARGPRQHRRNTVEAEQRGAVPRAEEQVPVRFQDGTVYVNNKRINEDYLPPEARRFDEIHEDALSANEYYVLGDNRRVSKDSRSFGAVDDHHIIGKAIFRFWPLSRFGPL